MKKNEKGQISLFFATTLFVLLSFLAFVINIGVFVKVKMNLQNAVDAAAYAGASVQARQLTNISYLNLEMRNVYKEWLFKYYVLGNLNINDVSGTSTSSGVRFNMQTYPNSPDKDQYNFPSVCIDFAGQGVTALCKNYVIPGLPRFSPVNVGGMDETTNSIMDTLADQKSQDCALRGQINFLSTVLWAYNVKSTGGEQNALQQIAPEIASDTSGAFPRAFELALRMRSLESHMNRAPHAGVCRSQNQFNSGVCSKSIFDVQSEGNSGDERINKAFYSGIRNLGGSEGDGNEELRASFTLREIPTTPYNDPNLFSTSNLLIPNDKLDARSKYYVDLKLMTLNLATFYTIFTPLKGETNVPGISADAIDTEAACASTKTGLPVHGYPLGFIKNPDVVTHYAVQGVAKFIGMFNPFNDDGTGIELAAFAAAKPFGGRIGPMLFNMKESSKITPRVSSGDGKKISSAFLLGLDSANFVDKQGVPLGAANYSPGAPLPIDPPSTPFWQSKQDDSVGGWADNPEKIVFAIPNMIYDYPDTALDSNDYFSADNIEVLNASDPSQVIVAGLYNSPMFEKFKANLTELGGNVSPKGISDALIRIKAPTRWEANNYLIPTPEEINKKIGVDSFGFIPSGEKSAEGVHQVDGVDVYKMKIFAPLFGPNAILSNPNQVKGVLDDYLKVQEPAIKKYLKAMNSAAKSVYEGNNSGATNKNLGEAAALLLSDIDDVYLNTPGEVDDAAIPSCNSISGKFIWFYYGPSAFGPLLKGDQNDCHPPSTSVDDSYLSGLLQKYFTSPELDGNFHKTQLVVNEQLLPSDKYFTAYRPGTQNDGNPTGSWKNFVRSTSPSDMRRNFYSAKFVTLKSLTKGGGVNYSDNSSNFPIHSEGNPRPMTGVSNRATVQQDFKNPINPSQIGLDLGDLNH